MIVDTHAHLTWDSFKPDFQEVIKRTKDADIGIVINVGADMQSSIDASILDCNPVVSYSSIGLHPEEIAHINSNESIIKNVSQLEQIYLKHQEKVIAVGECGLDYYRNPKFSTEPITEDEKINQKKLFLAQINLAKKLNLPLIVHSRDCGSDIFVPELNGLNGVFHSFGGNLETAKKILDLGFYLGINCTITYPKNEELREILITIPLDRILTETDCPFLPPQALRGQRNEPANVIEVIKKIAEIKNLSFDEVAQTTFNNAKTLFHLP
ncbi:MAG: TatD family hydrolase [Microgenomates group bacterium]|jgi:TatD DNase family protein